LKFNTQDKIFFFFFVDAKQAKVCSHATRSLHLVHVRTSWEEKKNVKKEQITGWLSLAYVQSARPIVRAPSLFPFIVLVCQPHRTTVQTEKRREKEER
jgi:hypothetical protein